MVPQSNEQLPLTCARIFQSYLVHEGDTITFDIPNRKLTLNVSDEEIAKRLSSFVAPAPRYKRGVFAKYANSVSSASEGAVTH